MASFKLSQPAKGDLKQIYTYGLDRWGEAQADRYYNALFDHLETIAADPRRYPPVSEIRPDSRRSVYQSHAIYFEIDGDHVLIIGIIRSQDTRRLSD